MNKAYRSAIAAGVACLLAAQAVSAADAPVADAPFQVVVQRGHSFWINAAAAVDDGELYATAGRDRTVKLWNRAGVLVRTFTGPTAEARSVAFSADGSLIACGDEHGGVYVWEMATGKRTATLLGGHKTEVLCVAFGAGGLTLFSGSGKGTNVKSAAAAVLWSLASGNMTAKIDSEQDVLSCAAGGDGSAVFSAGAGLLRMADDGSVLHFPARRGYRSLAYGPDGLLYAAAEDGVAAYDDYGRIARAFPAKGKAEGKFKAVSVAPGAGLWVEVRDVGDDSTLLRAHSFNGVSDRDFVVDQKNLGNAMCVAPAGDGSGVVVGYEPTGYPDCPAGIVWDLRDGSRSHLESETDWPEAVGSDPATGGLRVIHHRGLLSTWSRDLDPTVMTRIVKEFDFAYFMSAAFSPTGKYLALERLGHTGVLTPDGLTLKTQIMTDNRGEVDIGVSDDGAFILHSKDNAVTVVPAEKGTFYAGALYAEMRRFSQTAAFSPDGEWLAAGFHELHLLPAKNAKAGYKAYGAAPLVPSPPKSDLVDLAVWITATAFDGTGERIAYGRWNGELRIVDRAGTELARLAGHDGEVSSLAFSKDGKLLFSSSEDDGLVKIWNLATGEAVNLIVKGTEWCLYTADGYFDASAGGGRLVGISMGNKVFGADQFAARSNRPDIVLSRLGLGSDALLAHYRAQYAKRLSRLGLDEASLAALPDIAPAARISAVKREGNTVVLSCEFSAKGGDLRSYNAWVNEVPIFGSEGRKLDGRAASAEIRAELSPGTNKIEVGCSAADGLEAFRASTRIGMDGGGAARLYYIGFGVSKYADKALRLGYAAKDAKDLAALFKKMEGAGFEKVIAKTYTDAQVTPQAIAGAKALLADARPQDCFVLFVAGHGIHGGEGDRYFYLTHGADLDNLEGTCVDFEGIENLLHGIAPRSKLFLMDTCESGEREDAAASAVASAKKGAAARSVRPTASRGIAVKASPPPSAFKKNRYIYNDLSRRSGSIVFSSSRGGEASWEFKDLKNGVFTSAIKKGFSDATADTDQNGRVSADELRSYVVSAVPALVRERIGLDVQHPTVDRDNLYQKFDFPLLK